MHILILITIDIIDIIDNVATNSTYCWLFYEWVIYNSCGSFEDWPISNIKPW